jgi:hypothetical protein
MRSIVGTIVLSTLLGILSGCACSQPGAQKLTALEARELAARLANEQLASGEYTTHDGRSWGQVTITPLDFTEVDLDAGRWSLEHEREYPLDRLEIDVSFCEDGSKPTVEIETEDDDEDLD